MHIKQQLHCDHNDNDYRHYDCSISAVLAFDFRVSRTTATASFRMSCVFAVSTTYNKQHKTNMQHRRVANDELYFCVCVRTREASNICTYTKYARTTRACSAGIGAQECIHFFAQLTSEKWQNGRRRRRWQRRRNVCTALSSLLVYSYVCVRTPKSMLVSCTCVNSGSRAASATTCLPRRLVFATATILNASAFMCASACTLSELFSFAAKRRAV